MRKCVYEGTPQTRGAPLHLAIKSAILHSAAPANEYKCGRDISGEQREPPWKPLAAGYERFFKHLCARASSLFYFKQVCRSIQMREPCRRLDAWPQHVPFASLWGCARSSSPRGASRSHMWIATMRVVVVYQSHRESRENKVRVIKWARKELPPDSLTLHL